MDSNKQGLQIEFCSDITRLIHWRLNPLRASLKGLHIPEIYKGMVARVANCCASGTICKWGEGWLASHPSLHESYFKNPTESKNKLYSIITYNISNTNGYKFKHKEDSIMRYKATTGPSFTRFKFHTYWSLTVPQTNTAKSNVLKQIET